MKDRTLIVKVRVSPLVRVSRSGKRYICAVFGMRVVRSKLAENTPAIIAVPMMTPNGKCGIIIVYTAMSGALALAGALFRSLNTNLSKT